MQPAYKCMQQTTSIRVSKELIKSLSKLKISDNETYEDIIWDIMEPYLEPSQEVKESIEEGRKEYKNKETISFEDIKKNYRL